MFNKSRRPDRPPLLPEPGSYDDAVIGEVDVDPVDGGVVHSVHLNQVPVIQQKPGIVAIYLSIHLNIYLSILLSIYLEWSTAVLQKIV